MDDIRLTILRAMGYPPPVAADDAAMTPRDFAAGLAAAVRLLDERLTARQKEDAGNASRFVTIERAIAGASLAGWLVSALTDGKGGIIYPRPDHSYEWFAPGGDLTGVAPSIAAAIAAVEKAGKP